jgi:hypothetical protein
MDAILLIIDIVYGVCRIIIKSVQQVITVFTVFRLLTDFVCLYNYEFGLSLCKIVRSSVILLLPLFTETRFIKVTQIYDLAEKQQIPILWSERTIYHTRGKHGNHYPTDAVMNIIFCNVCYIYLFCFRVGRHVNPQTVVSVS